MKRGDLERIREKGGTAAVVGLGVSGLAALGLLSRQGLALRACDSRGRDEFDSRTVERLERHGVTVEFGRIPDDFLQECDLVVLSPGVDQRQPVFRDLAEKGVMVTGELALASALVDTPVIAVTGTNGKSTVVKLLGDMLAAAGMSCFVGGNYGTPLSEYLCGTEACDWLVLEVSSFQLDTAPGFRPAVGVLLNISPDHLDRYQDFGAYAASKLSMFAAQEETDTAVLNLDDPRVMAAPGRGRRVYFGRDRDGGETGVFVAGNRLVVRDMDGLESVVEVDNPALCGGTNMLNAAAALAAALAAGCGMRAAGGLAAFSPLAHRMETVAEIDGVRYVDDSKATNIGSLAAALEAMAGPVVLIAGGRDKGADYGPLVPLVREKVRAVVAIGEAREALAVAFGTAVRVDECDGMAAAVRRARGLARPGDTVLLSPACASFDMFDGYAHRGEVFRRAVLALETRKEACG